MADWQTKYRANPVVVDAYVIREIHPGTGAGEPGVTLVLDDGQRVAANEGMLARYNPVEGDYWVVQDDGYTYLNPREVFERKYSPAYASMNFGAAVELLKRGARVARRGWNGRDMWLAYSPGSAALPAEKFWAPHNREFATANGGHADVLPCITMKTADGKILMGWLASQTDMLANDWFVVA